MSLDFIQVTQIDGRSCFIRHALIEATMRSDDDSFTRVYTGTGFYRVKEDQAEVMAKLRDIDVMKGLQ